MNLVDFMNLSKMMIVFYVLKLIIFLFFDTHSIGYLIADSLLIWRQYFPSEICRDINNLKFFTE